MTHGLNVDSLLHPDYLVAKAISEAFPDGDIVLRPETVDGLTETFTVIYVGEVGNGIQYFVGLYGEHNLDDMPINPMNLEPLVLGVQLIDGRLTVADTLSVETGTMTIAVANLLMVTQYGEMLTTDRQSDDPDSDEWGLTQMLLTIYQDSSQQFAKFFVFRSVVPFLDHFNVLRIGFVR